jgi:hypothetical protein
VVIVKQVLIDKISVQFMLSKKKFDNVKEFYKGTNSMSHGGTKYCGMMRYMAKDLMVVEREPN